MGSPTYEATTEREQELLAEYRRLLEATHLNWGDCRSFEELKKLMQNHDKRDYDGLADALTEAYGGNRSDGAKRYTAFFDRFFHPVMHQGALHYVRRLDFDVGPKIGAPTRRATGARLLKPPTIASCLPNLQNHTWYNTYHNIN